MKNQLTDREQSIVRFAVHRFMTDAYSRLAAAAQDKDGRFFGPGAADAFAKDARDAEELLKKLPMQQESKHESA